MKKIFILLPLIFVFAVVSFAFAESDRFDYDIYNQCVQYYNTQKHNAEVLAGQDWCGFSRECSKYLDSLPTDDEIESQCEYDAENREDRDSRSFYHQLALNAANRDDYESVIEYLEKAIYYEPVGSEVYNITYNEIKEAKDILKEEQKQAELQEEQDKKAVDIVNNYIDKWNEYWKKNELQKALAEFQSAKNLMDSYTKISWHTEWMTIEDTIDLVKKQIEEEKNNKLNTEKEDTNNTIKIDELQEAILWMYEKWLTIFNEPVSFMASNWLRRDEAAKFFVQYAKEVMGKTPDYSKKWCTFNDLNQAWSDLKDVIVESCQLWLFQWHNGKFMPTQQLTNAQAITVFMRLLEWYKDESWTHFANNYYESAHAQWFLRDTPLDNKAYFDNYTTRWNVAKMLFRWQKSN